MSTILIIGITIVALVGLAIGMGVLIGRNKKPGDTTNRVGIKTGYHCPPSADPGYTQLINGKCFEPCPAGFKHSDTTNFHYVCVADCPAGTTTDLKSGGCTGMGSYQRPESEWFKKEPDCEARFGTGNCIQGGVWPGRHYREKCKEGYHQLTGLYSSWCVQDCPQNTGRPKDLEYWNMDHCDPCYFSGERGDKAADECPPEGSTTHTELIGGKCYEPCPAGYVADKTKCQRLPDNNANPTPEPDPPAT